MKKITLLAVYLYFFVAGCSNRNEDSNSLFKTESSGNDTTIINKTLRKVSQAEFRVNDSTLHDIIFAEKLSVKCKYSYGLARALFYHGNFCYTKNNYKEALVYYSKALDIAVKTNILLTQADCLERMASVHHATDDIYLAYKLYYESLKLYEELNYQSGIARIYNVIGLAYLRSDFNKAESYLLRAYDMNKKAGNSYAMIENKGNLGYLYRANRMFDSAEKIFNELVIQLVDMKDSLSLPVIYFNLSTLNKQKENFPKSIEYLKKAIMICEPIHDSSMLSTLYGSGGEILLLNNKIDSAKYFLEKSIKCSKMTGDIETEAYALSFLLIVDSVKGDFRSAFFTNKEIFRLTDSINKLKINNNVESTRLQYENEKIQHDFDLQKAETEQNLRTKRNIIIFLVLLIVIAILVSLLLNNKKRNLGKKLRIKDQELRLKALENEKKQDQLEINRLIIENNEKEKRLKENQLLNLSLSIKQKTELLEDISNKLKVKNLEDSDSEPTIQQIISQIGSHRAGLNETNLFNEKFSALHPEFFQILKEKHPALTKTELNFCAFLKINLSSKQIAAMLNIGPEAIRKTRYRIRKKMELDTGQSLEDFIDGL